LVKVRESVPPSVKFPKLRGGYAVCVGCGSELTVAVAPLLLVHVTAWPTFMVTTEGEKPFCDSVTAFCCCITDEEGLASIAVGLTVVVEDPELVEGVGETFGPAGYPPLFAKTK